jgi:hypothetical protein
MDPNASLVITLASQLRGDEVVPLSDEKMYEGLVRAFHELRWFVPRSWEETSFAIRVGDWWLRNFHPHFLQIYHNPDYRLVWYERRIKYDTTPFAADIS